MRQKKRNMLEWTCTCVRMPDLVFSDPGSALQLWCKVFIQGDRLEAVLFAAWSWLLSSFCPKVGWRWRSEFCFVRGEFVESRSAQLAPGKQNEKTGACRCKQCLLWLDEDHRAHMYPSFEKAAVTHTEALSCFPDGPWIPNKTTSSIWCWLIHFLSGLVVAVWCRVNSPGAVSMLLTSAWKVSSLRGYGFQTKCICWIHTPLAHCSNSHV